MESSTSRGDAAQKKQQEIKTQIAALQAQLSAFPDDRTIVIKGTNSPKRKRPEPTTLAPATPSPSESYYKHCPIPLSQNLEKKRRVEAKDDKRPRPKFVQPAFQEKPRSVNTGAVSSGNPPVQDAEPCDIERSKFLSKLAQVKGQSSQSPVSDTIIRTSAFSDTARPEDLVGSAGCPNGVKRDDRLALVEDLERGPYEFTSPSDDSDFKQLEPYSGIRLL